MGRQSSEAQKSIECTAPVMNDHESPTRRVMSSARNTHAAGSSPAQVGKALPQEAFLEDKFWLTFSRHFLNMVISV